MTNPVVTWEQVDAVAIVTLDRPEAMNALSRQMRCELADIMLMLDQREDIRVIVLTGAGNRAFSAGLDLKELGRDPSAIQVSQADGPAANPVLALAQCGKPIIAAINGVAITGGFELALACDILIAADNARFADTHARVGVMPGWGLSQKLPRLIGPTRAKEMSFSGNFIDAQLALDWGLVNHVVPAAQLRAAAVKLAQDIASADPAFLREYKALMDDGYGMALAPALALEQERQAAWNAAVTPQALEARRHAVKERGRAQ